MQENGTDIPVDVAPERTRIVLGLSPERWEDYVLGSFILVTPLRDASAGSFAEAYPSVDDAARTLRALLDSGGVPDKKQLETAMHCVDGEIALYSRLEKVRTHNLAGFAFLVQMTQEEHPNPANNGDLRYQFAGLTADGAHMVEATFRVKHPALPKDQAATGDTGRDDAGAYLRRDEKRLAEYSEGSFEPSLGLLKTLLRSIAVTH